jgi:hypothetical protein
LRRRKWGFVQPRSNEVVRRVEIGGDTRVVDLNACDPLGAFRYYNSCPLRIWCMQQLAEYAAAKDYRVASLALVASYDDGLIG